MCEDRFRDDYNKLVELDNITNQIFDISDSISRTSWKVYYIHEIFLNLRTTFKSAVKVWPKNADEVVEADFTTLANITRNLMEIHNVMVYFTERVSKDEFEYRYWLASIHKYETIMSTYSKLGFEVDEIIESFFGMGMSMAKMQLKKNSIFLERTETDQKELIKGKKAYYFNRINKGRFPIGEDGESAFYNLLSNSVHSYPLGISNGKNFSKMYTVNSLGVFVSSVNCTLIYTSNALLRYLNVRSKIKHEINKENLEKLERLKSPSTLYEWVERTKKDLKKENTIYGF